MNKVIATLIAGLFATAAFAQTPAATAPAAPVKAEAKHDATVAKETKAVAKAEGKETKETAKAEAKEEKAEAKGTMTAKAVPKHTKAKAHKAKVKTEPEAGTKDATSTAPATAAK